MDLNGLRAILITEAGAGRATAIEACLRTAGAEPVLSLEVDCSA